MSEMHKTTYLDENNICTGFGETNGNGLANAAGAAGDHGRLALEGEDAHCDGYCVLFSNWAEEQEELN